MPTPDLSPFASQMGLEIVEISSGRVRAKIKIKEAFCDQKNVAASGLAVAVAEELVTFQMAPYLATNFSMVTNENDATFIAPLRKGEMAYIECHLVHRDHSTFNWETLVKREDGQLVAIVSHTQILKSTEI